MKPEKESGGEEHLYYLNGVPVPAAQALMAGNQPAPQQPPPPPPPPAWPAYPPLPPIGGG